MHESEIKALIERVIPHANVEISGDGRHFEARIISDSFQGLSSLKRQQAVYAGISAELASGAIHAISLKTYTSEEWAAQQHG